MRLLVQRVRVQAPALLTTRTALVSSNSVSTRAFRYLVQQSAISRVPHSTSGASASRSLFERSWTLSGAAPLEKLKLCMPGVTLLRLDDSNDDSIDDNNDDVVANVRVTSDSAAVLAHVAVISRIPHRTIIEYALPVAPWNRHALPSHANLLTEILLKRSGLLRNLASSGDGLVVVDDGVLALHADAAVKLATTRTSQVAVTTARDVRVRELSIASAQQSRVYVRAPSVQVRDRLQVAATGDTQVHLQTLGHLKAPVMSLVTAGSGAVVRVVSSDVAVERTQSAVAGHGSIVIATNGDSSDAKLVSSPTCASHNIAVFGVGDVDCADVAAERAAIALAGQSRVAVATTHELRLAAFGRTAVSYLNAAPAKVIASKDKRGESRIAPMSDAARSERKQQREREIEALERFWRSLPTRESALDAAQQVPLHGASSLWHLWRRLTRRV